MTESQTAERPVVWLVAANFGASSEVWMHRQASGMSRIDLRVITCNYRDPESYPPKGFEVVTLDGLPKQSSNPLLAQMQLGWNAFRNQSLGGFRGSPIEARRVIELAEKDRPCVALCHYGTWAVRMAPLLDKLGIPIVAHYNGHDLSSALRGPVYRRNLMKWAPRFAANVVVADYHTEWLVANGCDPERVRKIPYGAPIAELTVAEHVAEQPCQFIMVGRLTDKKRPDLTLRAFARCREVSPDARLTVIGDGPLMGSCRALAKELGLEEAVKWLGIQPIQIVKERLASASVFVQHSVTAENGDKEGWPVAIGEAAGSGLPIISTRHASIPEQIDDGVTGLLGDELDWQTMGDHMQTLAQQPSLREQMGHAARAKLSQMSTQMQVERLEDVLLEMAATRQ